jgi:SAM-dependent MidA family methyltransferase
MNQLPAPSAEAIHHSQQLSQVIHQRIDNAGGWIAFDQFMQMALYEPGLGYYSAGAKKFGIAGDFVTAPGISPLFGSVLANQIEQILIQPEFSSKSLQILELGAGEGCLAEQILQALEQKHVTLDRYMILEVSADLRTHQAEYLSQHLPAHLYSRIQWLDQLPEQLSGVIIANEVLDAVPVHLYQYKQGAVFELGVISRRGEFDWRLAERASEECAHIIQSYDLGESYTIEYSPAVSALVSSLAQTLSQGAVLLIDYGFDAKTYYHPQRSQGTLMCHYRHYAHSQPFFYPGLQDITSHVNFSQVAEAGVQHGLNLVGYLPQSNFLINCGILDCLRVMPADSRDYLRSVSQVQKLVSPAEMGELFKVIAFEKGLALSSYIGFHQGDQSFRL